MPSLAEQRRAIAEEREAKKVREALLLRDKPPPETLRMAFEMMWFVRELREAANAGPQA